MAISTDVLNRAAKHYILLTSVLDDYEIEFYEGEDPSGKIQMLPKVVFKIDEKKGVYIPCPKWIFKATNFKGTAGYYKLNLEIMHQETLSRFENMFCKGVKE